ncbi:putative calcium-binding protein At1g02270 [Curcuma longa]|uniref:putative calcium-binding protein At1g02270 n=1 Tax=Curcuma longa TaxID=136217 RepID=UPI003D9F2340
MGRGSVVGSERSVSCTTFNILAPIYKRLSHEDQSCRESQHRAYWSSRNEKIIDRLLCDRSSIICLQEVWLGNDELVQMYEKRLGDAGYVSFKLARTNNRGDGPIPMSDSLPWFARCKPTRFTADDEVLLRAHYGIPADHEILVEVRWKEVFAFLFLISFNPSLPISSFPFHSFPLTPSC